MDYSNLNKLDYSTIANVPSSPVNVKQLQEELKFHPDNNFKDYLVNGFMYGFDTKVPNIKLDIKECKNLMSATKFEQDTDLLINSELEKGFLSGPFSSPPFKEYRVSPIGIAEGKYSKKKRIIVDLSAPHDNPDNPSINELIDKEQCSLSYVTIDDAIKQIVEFGPGTQLCKTDISDAFKLIPIRPSQFNLFCVKWRDLYYFYHRLCFGCRSSPAIFDEFSKAICWIARQNYGIHCVLHLLDDYLAIVSPDNDAQGTMDSLLTVFSNLNVPLAKHKTVGPTKVVEYLGVILDTDRFESRLPTDKLIRITDLLTDFLHRKTCTKRELLQLLGHLNFAMRIIIPGRSFVSHLLRLSTTVKELHHHVHLSAASREDIRMWMLFLRQWNGICMFHDVTTTAASDMELYTDAALTLGYGGYYNGHWFSEKWPSDLPEFRDITISMAFLELYPIVVAALLWGSRWSGRRILFHCDNLSTVHIIRKGRSPVYSIMCLMRQLTWLAAKYNFYVTAEHIPGVNNVYADMLSRLQVQKFKELVPQADTRPQKCPTLAADVLWDYTKLRH